MKKSASPTQLITRNQAFSLDQATMGSGITQIQLMQNAAQSVLEEIKLLYPSANRILIACGPGNNGGDGILLGVMLTNLKKNVEILYFGKEKSENEHLSKFNGIIINHVTMSQLKHYDLIIDAIFGTGLNKIIEGKIAEQIDFINSLSVPVIAIDMPSGIDSDTGQILGTAIKASYTISFVAPKLGMELHPGKDYCGQIIIKDIGITINPGIKPLIKLNEPENWIDKFPFTSNMDNKYSRGYVAIIAGEKPGASKLAAKAALRSGSGLVKIYCPKDMFDIYVSDQLSVMVETYNDIEHLKKLLDNPKISCSLIGPGTGNNSFTKSITMWLLQNNKQVVIDADAISVFSDKPQALLDLTNENCILTPHLGEFIRVFSLVNDKVGSCVNAAQISNANILLKGCDTILANSSGEIIVNNDSSKFLATAGSGDVLAGIIAGIAAQISAQSGQNLYLAAQIGLWIHSQCSKKLGAGMIAEDLETKIPEVLEEIYSKMN